MAIGGQRALGAESRLDRPRPARSHLGDSKIAAHGNRAVRFDFAHAHVGYGMHGARRRHLAVMRLAQELVHARRAGFPVVVENGGLPLRVG